MNLIWPAIFQALHLRDVPFSLLFLYMYKRLRRVISNDIFFANWLLRQKVFPYIGLLYLNIQVSYKTQIFRYAVKNRVNGTELWCQTDLVSSVDM